MEAAKIQSAKMCAAPAAPHDSFRGERDRQVLSARFDNDDLVPRASPVRPLLPGPLMLASAVTSTVKSVDLAPCPGRGEVVDGASAVDGKGYLSELRALVGKVRHSVDLGASAVVGRGKVADGASAFDLAPCPGREKALDESCKDTISKDTGCPSSPAAVPAAPPGNFRGERDHQVLSARCDYDVAPRASLG